MASPRRVPAEDGAVNDGEDDAKEIEEETERIEKKEKTAELTNSLVSPSQTVVQSCLLLILLFLYLSLENIVLTQLQSL